MSVGDTQGHNAGTVRRIARPGTKPLSDDDAGRLDWRPRMDAPVKVREELPRIVRCDLGEDQEDRA
jgi:hypothetical protein